VRAISSIAMAAILAASVILAGCGQKVIVLNTDRYTPQDSIQGPLPGDPQGDSLFFTNPTDCNDVRITFFPTTLSTPGTGLSIQPGCSITFIPASHPFFTHGSGPTSGAFGSQSAYYRISWLGQGERESEFELAVVTPLFAGVVDNSRSSLTITIDGVRYFPILGEQKLAPLNGFGAAHRILLIVDRSATFGEIKLRAESFNENTPLNDAVEVRVHKPDDGVNLIGINISVPDDAFSPYILKDLYVYADRE